MPARFVDYDDYHAGGRTAVFADVYERCRARTIEAVLARHDCLRTAGTFVDVGSGEGRYLPMWQRYSPAARLVAAELSQLAVARAARRYPFAEHLEAPADALPLPDESAHTLVTVEVLEHVPDPEAMLRECHRILVPDGMMLLSTPCGNRGSFNWLVAAVAREVRPGLGGGIVFGRFDDPTHLRNFRSRELRGLCVGIGFDICAAYYWAHEFSPIAERVELAVRTRLDIGRRSLPADRLFTRTLDAFAMLDFRLFRSVACCASSQILVLRRRAS